ncbi:uncharacterized protein LOC143280132 [Babylonia areolata]|uniref:uncharacterized protein LOC143280132 n=1 Tax=Babylonia areolata TaxID=304850 RepID=UPI003FCF068E
MRPTSANSGLRGPPLNLCDIIQRGYLSQVHLLVSLGANLEARDASGRTPLMLTAFVQSEGWGVGVARLLIEEGVAMSPRDRHGMNALHHACVYERVPLARVLLNAPDFDLLQADRFGNTALHYAAMSGNVNLVQLLVSNHRRFRQPLTRLNRRGHTAKDEARRGGYHLCAAILEGSDSAFGQAKEGNKNERGDFTESNPPGVFITTEDESFVQSEDPRAAPDEPKMGGEEAEEEEVGKAVVVVDDDEARLSLRREEDEEGGLFGPCDQLSQEEFNRSLLLSPHHTPPASDRSSSDLKTRSHSSPRLRRSGIRRAHPAGVRRVSIGSTSSTRSATSTKKLSLLSVHSSNANNNNNNDDTIFENGNNEGDPNGSAAAENEAPVEPAGSSAENLQQHQQQTSKSPSLHSLKRNSVLSENTVLLNNNITRPTTTNAMTNHKIEASQMPRAPRSAPVKSVGSQQNLRSRESMFATVKPPFQQQPLPYEKDPERIIHVASEHDFRNTREYVLKLTRMEFRPAHFDTDSLPVLVRPSPSAQHEEDAKKASNATGSWRDNFRFLYRHLEYKCSPSWREAAQPPPEPLMMVPQWGVTSPAVEEGDETTEKKVRRPSSSNRPSGGGQVNDLSTSSNVKRKISSNKSRKISAISPPSGLGQGDNLTTSSSESVSTGSKKKGGNRS